MQDGERMVNMVTDVCVKFNYDWLHVDKALGNFWVWWQQEQQTSKAV